MLYACLFQVACQSQDVNEKPARDYQLMEEDGIIVEVFDSTNTDDNRYTENNVVFTVGRHFTYQYFYQDISGQQFKFKEADNAGSLDYKERRKAWSFVPIGSADSAVIHQVEIEVLAGLEPFIHHIPDYNQTILKYDYPQLGGKQNFNSTTGVIENEQNIWLHPPRDRLFMILELNPFPFIQAPYTVGNEWDWTLDIGDNWADERWLLWEGSVTQNYTYKIAGKEKLNTPLGDLDCFVVDGTTTSRLGQSRLRSHFHPQYGFIKLDYTNIDGSKMIFKLSEVR